MRITQPLRETWLAFYHQRHPEPRKHLFPLIFAMAVIHFHDAPPAKARSRPTKGPFPRVRRFEPPEGWPDDALRPVSISHRTVCAAQQGLADD